jgi:hypothetical protein
VSIASRPQLASLPIRACSKIVTNFFLVQGLKVTGNRFSMHILPAACTVAAILGNSETLIQLPGRMREEQFHNVILCALL